MNKINEFFDWKRFSEGKEFQIVSMSAWTDYNNKDVVLGTNVCCVITADETVYSSPEVTNLFEKIYFRYPAKLEIACKYLKPGIVVRPSDPKCKISGRASGSFVNYNLSIECSGFVGADGKKII